jgi:hypothetical protein
MPDEFRDIEIREDIPVERQLLLMLVGVDRKLHQLREELHTMSTSIVTRDQFDAALISLLAAEAARDAAVTKALTDLIAKVAAGTVTTPADFTAELAQVATLQTNAAALTQTATADDPGPTTVPATPAAPTS